jgi:hypothetical protein
MYQYAIFAVDSHYNYASPRTTPFLQSFSLELGTDSYHTSNISWELDRACDIQFGYHHQRGMEFASLNHDPISLIVDAVSGIYLISNLISGVEYYFGVSASDNDNNQIILGSFFISNKQESYSANHSNVTYLTNANSLTTIYYPQLNSDISKLFFLTNASTFDQTYAPYTPSWHQIAEYDIASGIAYYITTVDRDFEGYDFSPDNQYITYGTEWDGGTGPHTESFDIQIVEWDRATATHTYITDGDSDSLKPIYNCDGSKILFVTDVDGYLGDHTYPSYSQLAEWDRSTGDITYIIDGDRDTESAIYNSDCSKVLFVTDADNFFGSHSNPARTQLAEWDRATGDVTYITDGNANATSYYLYSNDDKKILFTSNASNFGPLVNSGNSQIVEWDRTTGTCSYLTDGDDNSYSAIYNHDLSKVLFRSNASNFNGTHTYVTEIQIVEWDRSTGISTYITNGDGSSHNFSYNSDEQKIIFETDAGNFEGEFTPHTLNTELAEWDRASGLITYLTNGDKYSAKPFYMDNDTILFTTNSNNYVGQHDYPDMGQLARWIRP